MRARWQIPTMSWKAGAKSAARGGAGCLNDLLMWTCVAPGLGILVAVAWLSGDPALILGVVVIGLLFFALYLLASWDD